jgi:hypothetical protein
MDLGHPRHNVSMTPPAALRFPRSHAAEGQAALDRGLSLGLTLLGTALVGLIGLQYTLPSKSDSVWGLNLVGLRQYQNHLGLGWVPALNVDSYSLYFRLLLLVCWCGYALAVLSGFQGAALQPRRLLVGIMGAALITALLAPPLLSHDVYAYAAHGRLYADYSLNPYFAHSSFLKAHHDPIAPYITWDNPTVYGPVWTWIEIASAALTRSVGIWPQVVLLKLVQAAALVASALAGRRLTKSLCPGRENLTLLAIGLNPLLLLEGVESGHNDLLLAAFLLLGAVFFTEKKYAPAALLLGLSIGVKFITLAVLPWLLLEYLRGHREIAPPAPNSGGVGFRRALPYLSRSSRTPPELGAGGRHSLLKAAVGLLLVALPLVLAFAPLWHGAATLASVQDRSAYHLSAAIMARNAAIHLWLTAHGLPLSAASAVVFLSRNGICLVIFTALTLALVLRPVPNAWLSAWCVLAAALMFYAFGNAFPWYILWFWPVCLVRWNRLHIGLSMACFCLSLIWMAGYGITYTVR